MDGVLFDLKRRILGEFFSAATNIQLLSTLCSPNTMAGPMPAVDLLDWSTTAATPERGGEVVVNVRRTCWSTAEAAALRALPASKEFCKCAGADDCAGAPAPPVATATIVYRLAHDRLDPSAESRQPLAEIAAQWGHHAGLKAWNLKMRGY